MGNIEKVGEPVLDMAIDTINKGKQALVFVNTKRSAEKVAEDISKRLKEDVLPGLSEDIRSVLGSPTRQCERLARCVKKGVAFHHAGLHSDQKSLIEDNFREGSIRIIACTPTLAAGLDLPAFRAIIRDLKRHGGNWGMVDIPVLEYHQMAGRAGRPGKDPYGEVVTFARSDDEEEEIHEKYIRGYPESIYSKLAVEPVLRTYVLSLVASGYCSTEGSLIEFFGKTFWARQYKDMHRLEQIIIKMIELLEGYGFIYGRKRDTDGNDASEGFVSASDLDDRKDLREKKLKATPLGKRVAELYLDPYTANHLITCMRDAAELGDLPDSSFLHMISHTIEMRPLIRMGKKTEEIVSDFIIENEETLLEHEPSMYDEGYREYYDSINTTLFFMDWIEEIDEDKILEKFNARPGETRYKLDTAEWLLFASTEFAEISGLRDLKKRMSRLSVRVKNGVKEELLPLLKFRNVGRVRARKLFNNGIKDIRDVKSTDVISLSQIVGSRIAKSLKEQTGEEVKEVPKGKRIGQTSISKY